VQHERIATLDILRGWAIFGVLLMDIEARTETRVLELARDTGLR
jgi:uncharacterized membrane protein YeiB